MKELEELKRKDLKEYRKCSLSSIAWHVAAILEMQKQGAIIRAFDPVAGENVLVAEPLHIQTFPSAFTFLSHGLDMVFHPISSGIET